MKSILSIIFFSFALISNNVFSQAYYESWYNTDNGLTQNSVKDIVADSNGFLWLSTENGIVRFDGNSFFPNNNLKVKNQAFKNFYRNVSGDSIFIGNAYDDDVLLIHNRRASVYKKNAYDLYNIKYDGQSYYKLQKKDINAGLDVRANYSIAIQSGYYYILKHNLKYYNLKKRAETVILVDLKIRELGKSIAFSDLIFFPQRKVCLKEGKIQSITVDPIFLKEDIKTYWSLFNNQAFLIDGNDVYKVFFSENSLRAKKIVTYKNFSSYNFNSIYFDSYYNKLFLGSITKGLCIIGFPQIHVVQSTMEKSKSTIYYSLLPYLKGSVISPSGVLYNNKGVYKQFPLNSKSDKYNMIYDIDGNIILKDDRTIYKLYKTSNFRKTESILFDYRLSTLAKDSDLYFVGLIKERYNGILNIYRNSDFRNLKKQFYFKTTVNDAIKLSSNELLVGCRDGIYIANLNSDTTAKLNLKDNFYVRNIIKSSEGNFWIFTQGQGFYLYKKKKLLKMPLDKQKFLLNAHCMIEDNKGFLWISSNNGLFKVSKKQLLLYSDNFSNKPVYYRYTTNDGLLTNEFNGGCTPCGNGLDNGEIVFPSLNGIVFFNPQKINSYVPRAQLFVERASVDDKEIYFENILSLPNNFYRTEVKIDLPYFDNQENVFLEAKLDLNEWEPIKKDRKFSFTTLDHGDHTLLVRLSDINSRVIYKKIKITVPPLFYQSIWFKTLCIVFLIAFLYIIFYLRLKYLKNKNSILEETINKRTSELKKTLDNVNVIKERLKKEIEQQKKLIGTISHDITTPIRFLSILTKDLYLSNNEDPRLKKKYLESIYKSTQQLYAFTQTLKEYAEIYSEEQNPFEDEFYSLYHLIQKKKELFEFSLFNSKVVIQNNIDIDISLKINRKVLAVIIHNLLDNAVKNTSEGQIIFLATDTPDKTFIYLSDTGIGMTNEQISYYNNLQRDADTSKLLLQKFGMGLHLVLQMLSIIEGEIFFEHNLPTGTQVKLILKKSK